MNDFLTPANVADVYPLSPMQKGMLFHSVYEPGSSVYVEQLSLRLAGAIDHDAMAQAWQHVVHANELLRTVFRWRKLAEPAQVVLKQRPFTMDIVELDATPATPQEEAALEEFLRRDRHTPMPLDTGPLMRVTLLRCGGEDRCLVWAFHHILLDGWSMPLLLGDLMSAYDALRRGERPRTPQRAPFRDYIAWLRRQDPQAAQDYWRGRLQGLHTRLPLPLARRDDLREFADVGEVALTLDADLCADITRSARQWRAAPNAVFQAAFAVLLSRLAGTSDVVWGTTVSGRPHDLAGVEQMIGQFTNTLPLRVQCEADTPADALVAQLQQRIAEMSQHAWLELPRLREFTALPGNEPFFQILFVFENFPVNSAASDGGMQLAGVRFAEMTNFPLTVIAAPAGDGYVVRAEYAREAYDEAAAQQLMALYGRVLAGLVRGAAARVGDLPLLEDAQVAEIACRDGAPRTTLPVTDDLASRIARQAERDPQRVAVTCGDDAITYGDLLARARRLAQYLRTLGVGPEVPVALCLERSVDAIVAVLAVLEAGGAYLPIEPHLPDDRVQWMLSDSGVQIGIGHGAATQRLREALPHVVCLDADAQAIAAQSAEPVVVARHPQQLAYIIYTSGSTGRPKGSLITQANALRLFDACDERFRFDASDIWTMVHSYAFDFSVWEIFGALLHGAHLVVVPSAVARSPQDLLTLLDDTGTTVLSQTPSAFTALLQAAGAADDWRWSGPLRYVVFGGEGLDTRALAPWFRHRQHGAGRLINMYGITETTVHVTFRDVPAEDAGERAEPAVGLPLSDLSCVIADARGQLLPDSVAGEILVGGDGLARGYLGRPGLTAERFIPDPYSGRPGARLYRSGDLGRRNARGELEHLGRIDQQVKIRGFRIELGEISTVAAAAPGVQRAVALARPGPDGAKRLVAWVQPADGCTVDIAEVRRHLQDRLPDYMVPAAIVEVAGFSLTANGKLDTSALPDPDAAALVQRPYEAPLPGIETQMAAVWSELLSVPRIGRDDNFFELGGHSLLALSLSERLRKVGIAVDVRTLFEQPTLRELAAAVTPDAPAAPEVPPNRIPAGCTHITPDMLPLVTLSQEAIDRIVATVPGGAANVQDLYPLAPLQQGMFFHHVGSTEGDPYLLGALLSLEERTMVDDYLRALQAVLSRHDILRTSVQWEGLESPVQVVWRHADLPVREYALDPADGDIGEQLWACVDPLHHRIDLRTAPLMRVALAHDAAQGRWLLAMQYHHLAIDHTAMEVLQREVHAYMVGREAELPPPQPFRQFVAQTLSGDETAAHEAFFTKQLGDIDAPTAPFDLLDVQAGGMDVREARLPVDPALTRRLRERARLLGVSAASLHHLAWALVLARTTGRRDVVFATVLFGRLQGGQDALRSLGMFINTLPIRFSLDDTGVREAVRQAQATLSELLRHEHASLALAQRCSGVEPPSPLFTTLLNYRHGDLPPETEDDASAPVRLLRAHERTNYPLLLSVDDGSEGFSLTAQAQRPMDPARICAYMHQALQDLVQALEQEPARPWRTLDAMPATERAQLLAAASGPRAVGTGLVHARVDAQVVRTPDAIAVSMGDRHLSYRDLDARATRLAKRLRALGVGPDARVAICCERSPELVVGVLGILKAGAAYVPLDAAHPAQRLARMLEDSAPLAVLTGGAGHDAIAALSPSVPLLSLDAEGDDADDGVALSVPDLRDDHLAYVIYTSGSTGQPKGTAMPHRALANLLAWHEGRETGAPPVTLQFASIGFDVAFQEIFTTLAVGGRLVMIEETARFDPERLRAVLREQQVTRLFLPNAALRMLAEASQNGGDGAWPDTIREIITAGDQLKITPAVIHLLRRFDGCVLDNHYGPTETHVVTAYRLEGDPATWPALPAIGRPLPGVRAYVLDGEGRPAPTGVPGELVIGGIAVARGYLHQGVLTRERFVADPFDATPGARMYRTGDLVRWQADGELEYLGRNDFQIKIRGHRVEPGEIETRLAAHPAIREAAVLAFEDGADRRLVCYFTHAGDAPPDVGTLRDHVAAALPEYMVPAAFVPMAALPLSRNGKLDRAALPAPDAQALAQRAFRAPATEAEILLAGIWSELLNVPRVGRDDNFFELGGHSLLAIRLVNRWSMLTGGSMAMRDVFDARNLIELAARATGTTHVLAPIEPLPPSDCHPLSHAQRRIWFQVQLEGAEEAYNMPSAVRVRGPLDTASLARNLERLVARHAALRTTFIPLDGEPMQWVAEHVDVPLPLHDLTTLPADEREPLARGQLAALAIEPFNLETGPLLRGGIWRLGEDDHVVALVVHHIVSDGWSLELLVHELCEGEGDGPAPLQYVDYAAWQRQRMDSGEFEPQRRYWHAAVAEPPVPLSLPLDRPRGALHGFRGSRTRIELPGEMHAAMLAFAARHGASPFMVMLAAWNLLLHRWCGQDDIIVGVPVAGRQHPQLERMLGVFVNTLPLRTRLANTAGFDTLLQGVRQTVIHGLANQDYPFESLVGEISIERDLSRQPLFDTSFAWQTAAQKATAARSDAPVQVENFDFPFDRSKFDLAITVAHEEAATQIELEFNTDLFDIDTAARMLDSLRTLLSAALAAPSTPLRALPVMDAASEHEVLHALGGARSRFDDVGDLARALDATALRHAARPAVSFGGSTLTYAELHAQANRLAQHLRALGVGPEQPVAICLPRSAEMIVAILGVLKAGGAYLPIEPDYPDDRAAFMVVDAGARVAIGRGPTAERMRAWASEVVCLERDAATLAAQPDAMPQLLHGPDSLAYVIFTSGSTGRPKGTLLTHRNAMRLFAACDQRFAFDEQDVWTLFHSVCFDFSVWEIFGALLHGARLVVVPQTVARSPMEFTGLMRQHGVTVLSQTPSAFGRLLDSSALAEDWAWTSAIRYVVFGGEALEHAALRPWFAHRTDPQSKLINMYGITETTVHVTWREVQPEDVTAPPARRVGGPLADLALYVLDADAQPVPVGVCGEIYVGGAGLARGYAGRPGLTAQRFLPDPFSGEAGARLYRSGDLARWRADGDLEYMGRADQQVKIRGHRIEPGEIEAAMLAHETVTGAAVLVTKDRAQRDGLLMYYTGPEPISTTALRAFLGRTLPEYMLPLGFVHLHEFPLTNNGKLDRAKLPYLQAVRPELDTPYVAPRNEVETQLAAIWRDVLGVDRVGIHDNFFDLGGESFSAYRVMARVASDMGQDLPVSAIFQAQTVLEMGERVHAAIDASDERMLVQLQAGAPGRRPFFCVHPAGGDVLGFQDLARALGTEQPFYGLQSHGRFLDPQANASIEAMAAAYVREMRTLQPEGPYLLGGHSMGAAVAFEMARQLDAAGQRIGVLALMDGEAQSANGLLDTLMLVCDTFELGIGRAELEAVPDHAKMDHVMRKSKKRFARVLEIAYDLDILPRGFRTRDAEQFMARIASNIDLALRYRLQPLAQPAVLFIAEEASENTPPVNVDLWRAYTPGGLTVIPVPGNHLTLVKRPHATTLAARLAELFRAVDVQEGTGSDARQAELTTP
jgi:amino acid adenylation domain-containing protein